MSTSKGDASELVRKFSFHPRPAEAQSAPQQDHQATHVHFSVCIIVLEESSLSILENVSASGI